MRPLALLLVGLAACSGARASATPRSSPRAARDASDSRDASESRDTGTAPLACLEEAAMQHALACDPRGLEQRGLDAGLGALEVARFDALTQPQRGGGDRVPERLASEPRALSEHEAQVVSLGTSLVCSLPVSAQEASVRYRVARVFYQANRYATAAAHFRALLFRPADVRLDRELRTFAADLYLDSLNALATRGEPPRPACREVMREDVPRLRALLCGVESRESEDFCGRIALIQCQLEARSQGNDPGACRTR